MTNNELQKLFEENLSTFSHLSKIRAKLWTSNTKSKVSIMVGAGFSLNAAKIEESFKRMALWDELKNIMVKDLNNHNNVENKSVLEIGELYSSEYGRSALDELLKISIPDENYEPSELYKKLLNLPWADVYTTNYDTLLERSKSFIYERNYQVVYDISDIPTSVQPRIVKLHGSFPANRPFVFTKKDYDSYPEKFSPFVNMVQQSIMETTFVLIGFSGDDPNFEKWTYWVRKNLKDHMPKIYMIGIDEGHRHQQLEDKGITLIDFKDVYSESGSYTNMFNDLFDFLARNPEENNSNWPFSEKNILDRLVDIRSSYPGWIVLPDEIRRNYYHSISKEINDFENGFILRNSLIANTKFKKSTDITKEVIKKILDVIWLRDLFYIPLTKQSEKLLLKAIGSNLANNQQLSKMYLVLLKEARLDNKKDEFFNYKLLLDDANLDTQDKHQLQYELIQFYVNENELNHALELMNEWKVGDREPEWGVKKACLYKKLKKNDLAEKLFKTYLQVIRKLLSIKIDDYRLLSLESIILSHFKKIGEVGYASERLKTLNDKQCFSEREFSSTLRSSQKYTLMEAVTITEDFDLTTRSVKFGNDDVIPYELYESFAVMVIDEQYYFSKNVRKKDKENFVTSLENVQHLYKHYSLKKLILQDDKKLVIKILTRAYVLYIDEEVKKMLIKLLYPTLQFDERKSTINDNIALDIYSRLYMVFDKNEKVEINKKILNATHRYYDKNAYLNKSMLERSLIRICKTLDREELNDFLYSLILSDVPKGIESVDKYDFFDPIYVLFDRYYHKFSRRKVLDRVSEQLLDVFERSEVLNIKKATLTKIVFLLYAKRIGKRSITRLNALMNNMDGEQIVEISKHLSLTEFKNNGVYDFSIKNPQTEGFKHYLNQKIPSFYERTESQKKISSGDGAIHYFYNSRIYFGYFVDSNSKIKLPKPEYYNMWLDNFFKWWEVNKEGLLIENMSSFIADENAVLEAVVYSLTHSTLSLIPLEYLRDSDKENIEVIFNEIFNHKKLYAIKLLPIMSRLKLDISYNLDWTLSMMKRTTDHDIKISGLKSLFHYVVFSKKREIKLSSINKIYEELVGAVKYAEGDLLKEAISTLSKILDYLPGSMNNEDKNFLVDYLCNYLDDLKEKIENSVDSLGEERSKDLQLIARSSELASILIKYESIEFGEKLEAWRTFILNHPLPEVKENMRHFDERKSQDESKNQ